MKETRVHIELYRGLTFFHKLPRFYSSCGCYEISWGRWVLSWTFERTTRLTFADFNPLHPIVAKKPEPTFEEQIKELTRNRP